MLLHKLCVLNDYPQTYMCLAKWPCSFGLTKRWRRPDAVRMPRPVISTKISLYFFAGT